MNKNLLLFGTMGLVAGFTVVYNVYSNPSVVPRTTTITTPVVNVQSELVFEQKTLRSVVPEDSEVVKLEGPIGENAQFVVEQIRAAARKSSKVYLLINSPGGSVFDGAQIISAMEASPKPVYTVCTLLCASMAAIIHQYGKERYMLDRSILMFHDAAGGLQGPVPQMTSRLNFINSYLSKVDAYISSRTGLSLKDYSNESHKEIWLDADDALKRKFSDSTVSLSLEKVKTVAPMPFLSPSERTTNTRIKLNWE